MKSYFSIVIILIFLILSGCFYAVEKAAPAYDFAALMVANALLALMSLISWQIIKKQLQERPQAFVRGVYSATLLKLAVCIAGVLIYVLLNRKTIHKPSLFVLFGIYAVYSVAETVMLSNKARQVK